MSEDVTPSSSAEAALAALRERVSELERQVVERDKAAATLQDTISTLQTVIDGLPYAIYWKDRGGVYRGCNRQFAQDVGPPYCRQGEGVSPAGTFIWLDFVSGID